MSESSTRKKLTSIAITIGIILAAGLIAYAAGSIIFDKSFEVNPTYTYSYDIELQNTSFNEGELLPGDCFTVSTTVKSKSTGNSYMFLEIKCKNDIDDKAIYNFVPAANSGWTTIKREDGLVLVVYGLENECSKLDLSGQVVLDIGYDDYANLASVQDPLKASFTICGIHSDKINEQYDAIESVPDTVYSAYLNENNG